MTDNQLWRDEYWLVLMQLYLRKPVGLKPLYSKGLVSLSIELHIHPKYLYRQMFRLRELETPYIEKLWNTYAKRPQKLMREVKWFRQVEGFGNAKEFYKGVEVNETFEKDFRPLPQEPSLMPVTLILVLDLYFRLTPPTMVVETPEVKELSALVKANPSVVIEAMDVFRCCDPYLPKDNFIISPLLIPCQEIWKRYGNGNPEELSALASQLKEYFKS